MGEAALRRSARLHHKPDAYGWNLSVIAIAMRCRGFKANGVTGREHMLVKTQCQLQLPADQIRILGATMPHQPIVG